MEDNTYQRLITYGEIRGWFKASLTKSNHDKIILQTKKQLTEYFQGKRKNFDLSLVPQGTPFQMQAWQQLLKVPYGSTISYAEQAKGSRPYQSIISCLTERS